VVDALRNESAWRDDVKSCIQTRLSKIDPTEAKNIRATITAAHKPYWKKFLQPTESTDEESSR
jgi:hypothetical protein